MNPKYPNETRKWKRLAEKLGPRFGAQLDHIRRPVSSPGRLSYLVVQEVGDWIWTVTEEQLEERIADDLAAIADELEVAEMRLRQEVDSLRRLVRSLA